MRNRIGMVVTLAALAAVVGFAAPGPVAGAMHLQLSKSMPAKDSVLASAPDRIQLWYSQAPQLRLSSVTLSGPNGAVTLARVAQDSTDPKLLTARIEGPMPSGAYTIAWRTASSDGHAIRGEIPFRVK